MWRLQHFFFSAAECLKFLKVASIKLPLRPYLLQKFLLRLYLGLLLFLPQLHLYESVPAFWPRLYSCLSFLGQWLIFALLVCVMGLHGIGARHFRSCQLTHAWAVLWRGQRLLWVLVIVAMFASRNISGYQLGGFLRDLGFITVAPCMHVVVMIQLRVRLVHKELPGSETDAHVVLVSVLTLEFLERIRHQSV